MFAFRSHFVAWLSTVGQTRPGCQGCTQSLCILLTLDLIRVINVHMATTTGHDSNSTTTFVMTSLNRQARAAFETFLANHPNVQAASMELDEAHFGMFLENNMESLVREFDRATS